MIGNPPYISALEAKKILPEEIRNGYKRAFQSATGAYDMYIIFIELGLSMLTQNGTLAFITPSKYLSAEYAIGLRSFILSGFSLAHISDYSSVKVFESAGVSTLVSIIRKMEQQPEVTFTSYRSLTDIITHHCYSSSVLTTLPNNIWGHLLSTYADLFFKIYDQSSILEEHAKVNACSTAGEADVYEDNLTEAPDSHSFKFLNNGTLNRYASYWGIKKIRKGLLCPYLSTDHMTERRAMLFKKPKLIFAKIAKCPEVFYDSEGEYSSANTNMVYDVEGYDLRALVGYFNSSTFNFVYKVMFGGLSMLGSLQFQAPQIRKSLIPNVIHNSPEICRLVDKVMEIKSVNPFENTVALEKQIDNLFYGVYGLTAEEQCIIESL